MRFRADSEERSCGVTIPSGNTWYGPLSCMRTTGHEGEHIATVGDAARADGKCFGCRVALGSTHLDDCFADPRDAT